MGWFICIIQFCVKTIYVLLRILKFCIDRLSIDNAAFYRGMSPGTSPGTHSFWLLRGDVVGYLGLPLRPKWRDEWIESPNDTHRATPLLCLCVSPLLAAWVVSWLEMRTKQGVAESWGLFLFANIETLWNRRSPWPQFHTCQQWGTFFPLRQHPSIHMTTPRETILMEGINEFDDSILMRHLSLPLVN
jgi:hypothetical protein